MISPKMKELFTTIGAGLSTVLIALILFIASFVEVAIFGKNEEDLT